MPHMMDYEVLSGSFRHPRCLIVQGPEAIIFIVFRIAGVERVGRVGVDAADGAEA